VPAGATAPAVPAGPAEADTELTTRIHPVRPPAPGGESTQVVTDAAGSRVVGAESSGGAGDGGQDHTQALPGAADAARARRTELEERTVDVPADADRTQVVRAERSGGAVVGEERTQPVAGEEPTHPVVGEERTQPVAGDGRTQPVAGDGRTGRGAVAGEPGDRTHDLADPAEPAGIDLAEPAGIDAAGALTAAGPGERTESPADADEPTRALPGEDHAPEPAPQPAAEPGAERTQVVAGPGAPGPDAERTQALPLGRPVPDETETERTQVITPPRRRPDDEPTQRWTHP
jgi:hypothetical protein